MPRFARAIAVGCAHHITQRGNNRQDVFFVDEDRRVYLRLLAEEAARHHLEVLGYCLMTNHVHVVAIPRAEDALAKGIGRTHFRYSQYLNRFHRRSGHLWQGRFYSCALDERHLWLALQYMCRRAWRYAWSSAAAHTGESAPAAVLDLRWWDRQFSAAAWRKELSQGLTEEQVARLRVRTRTGRPLGSDAFLSKLETRLGRRVRALPVGRPKKNEGKPEQEK
jgi:putative transposase